MLYILNKQEQIISTLSNKGDMNKVVPYFEDIHIEELDTGVETFEFKTISNSKASNSIQVGNYVAFKDKEYYKIFQIREVKEVHAEQVEKAVYCESACLELLNEVVRPIEINSANLNQFLKAILDGTSWSIGMLDASLNEVIPVDLSGYDNVYKVIQDVVIGEFGGEIRFRVEIANNRIIAKYIDVFAKRGRVTKHRFEYGVNMTSVEKIVDSSELVTALIGLGKNDITFKEVESDDKPQNQDFIINEDSYNRWNNKGSHIMGVFNCESESPQELLRLTREELKRRCNPKITYNLEVELLGEDVDLGDEVFVIDNEFNPPLYLSARVNKLERSKTDSQSNRCTLANFKEVKSSITSEMRALADGLEGKVDDKINQKFPIGNNDIQNDAITSDKIKDNQVYGSHIFANQITADHIDADQIKAKHIDTDAIKSKHIDADQIKSEHIYANQITAKHLSSDSIKAEHIDANQITAKHLSAGSILAGSTVIGQGAIGSAQISELSADQISSGTIDTSNINIQGKNGMLNLRGNRLQVFTGSGNERFERVSLGDVNNDGSYYGLLVRGSDGNTVLFDEKGITEKGITDGLITNEHISVDTQIDGSKLDISSVIREINDDTEKITGHAISVEGSTLSAKLSQIENKQNDDGKVIENHTTQIKANEKAINLKVDNQKYTEDKNAMESKLTKNTSDISQLNNEIKLKVEQTDINTAIDNLQVGTSQLVHGTQNFIISNDRTKGFLNSNSYGITYSDMDKCYLASKSQSGKTSNNILSLYTSYVPCKVGQTFTVSADIKVEDVNAWDVKIPFIVEGYDVSKSRIENIDVSITHEDTNAPIFINNEWVRMTYTYTIKQVATKYFGLRLSLFRNGNISFKLVKIEEGNKATSWLPSQQDVTTEISNVKTEVTTDLEGFKTEVSKSYYTKDDVDNKGYQTSSQVEQTVDGLRITLEESGGFNLLRNSAFKADDFENGNFGWNSLRWDTQAGGSHSISIREIGNTWALKNRRVLHGAVNDIPSTTKPNTPLRAGFDSESFDVSPNAQYTLCCLLAGHRCQSVTIEMLCYDKNGNRIPGNNAIAVGEINKFSGGENRDNWRKVKHTFTTQADAVKCHLRCFMNEWTGEQNSALVFIGEPIVAMGTKDWVWTPSADEVYTGITSIDKDGITVRNSNSNTYTQIDSSSFSVNDNNGGTVAEFSRSSNIPNLTSGTINAERIYATNVAMKSLTNTNMFTDYFVNGANGNDNNNGLSENSPFKTIDKALSLIPDIINTHFRINIKNSLPGFNIAGKFGSGIIELNLDDNVIFNEPCSIDGCTCKIRINDVSANGRATFKTFLNIFRSSYVKIYNCTWTGGGDSGANIHVNEGSFVIVDNCDLGHTWCAISNRESTLHVRNNYGSELDWYVACGMYSKTYFKSSESDYVPDSKFGLYSGNGDDATAYVHKGADVNFIKKPSAGWNPIYKPTQRVSTWNFNSIWSDETLNGWENKSELIQGYYSGWNTGRWTGYMQMADGFSEIRNAISGGTNLSGRIYIQRRTSSGNSTGSKLCLYASDGTTITTNTNIDRGEGVWVNLNNSIISKIQSGAIKYFYLKSDSNNASTYFKCESNAKIEITYTK
ncbi:phage tail spike protein [Paraclostridium bifermentans]|uniref:phage tail spike protein n=1 Tax=Paraclostridium bifermentans TaxID=1490 RepID=UPI002912417D|nr:phage tail spike protein [Paraclostridium bifermentans]MDU3338210.1 phage tail spike protein [Paraclostridium bifermentans]